MSVLSEPLISGMWYEVDEARRVACELPKYIQSLGPYPPHEDIGTHRFKVGAENVILAIPQYFVSGPYTEEPKHGGKYEII